MKKHPTAQAEIPGTESPKTKSQLRALELAEARYKTCVAKDAEKKREIALIQQMIADKEITVKIRDTAGQPHVFHLEDLKKLKHTTR